MAMLCLIAFIVVITGLFALATFVGGLVLSRTTEELVPYIVAAAVTSGVTLTIVTTVTLPWMAMINMDFPDNVMTFLAAFVVFHWPLTLIVIAALRHWGALQDMDIYILFENSLVGWFVLIPVIALLVFWAFLVLVNCVIHN